MARRLLPGRPAIAYTRPALFLLRIASVFVAIDFLSVLMGLFDSTLGGIAIQIFLGIAVVCALTGGTLSAIVSTRASTEASYGYTTLMSANQHVEQLDPVSGRTIRAAGEPYLTREKYAERMASGFDLSAEGEPARPPAQHDAILVLPRRKWWENFVWVLGVVAGLLALWIRLTQF